MRVQVNLSDDMVKKVDFYADKIGVTRAALCSILVAEGIAEYDATMDFDVVTKAKLPVSEVLRI